MERLQHLEYANLSLKGIVVLKPNYAFCAKRVGVVQTGRRASVQYRHVVHANKRVKVMTATHHSPSYVGTFFLLNIGRDSSPMPSADWRLKRCQPRGQAAQAERF